MALHNKMLFFLALVFCFGMINARTVLRSKTTAEVSQPTEEIITPLGTVKSSEVCKLCEQYASEALEYLAGDETQAEIITAFHHVCSKMNYLKEKCITLVDQYVPLFFEEIENISPEDFCDKIKLCKEDTRQSFSILKGDESIMKDNMPIETKKGSQWCNYCEEIATDALSYLEKNQTETEIVEILLNDCAKFENFEEECVALVEYYSPLLFSQLKKASPERFCEKIHFCISDVSVAANIRSKIEQLNDDTCSICEEVTEQIAIKLKDPDTQLEILEILLKGCSKAENYVQKCKRLVLQYAPLLMARLEKFIETNDVCSIIHACKNSKQNFLAGLPVSSA